MVGLMANAGASLALAFIVSMVVGIILLAMLYLGSAVVVLERFGRVSRSPFWMIAMGVLTSLVAASVMLLTWFPELQVESWGVWWQNFTPALLQMLGASAIAMAICLFMLRRIAAERLGSWTLSLLALGASLFAVTVVSTLSLVIPLVVLIAVAVLLARRRRSRGIVSGFERPLRHLIVAWGMGLLAALLPLEQQEATASLGLTAIALFFAIVTLGLLPLAAAGLIEMRRSVEWFIAIRYLVAKRRQVFISAISAICVAGIAAGVWLIIVVLSVMNGFERTWRDEILGNRAHFTVHSSQGPFGGYDDVLSRVRDVPGVVGVSPYLDAEGMVRSEGGRIFSVRVRGIEPASVAGVTDLREDLIAGSLEDLEASEVSADETPESAQAEFPGIVIGNQLALSVDAEVGDDLLLISPFGGPQTPLGPAPRLTRFRVVGVFQSSFFQYDEVYTYVSIPAAQRFRRAGDVIDGIEARTTDFYRSRRVGRDVRDTLGYPYYTRDWKDFFPAFFQALKSERIMMFLLLTMIMVVAAFLIVATLIMMIMEKSSDIAILKAMGAEDSAIERIFAVEGTLIGMMGTLLGVVAGVAVTHQLTWLQRVIEDITGIDTLPASVYQFSSLPSEVDPIQVGLVVAIAMILCLGATLLPSRQGARLDPAEGLRYE